MHLKQMPFVKLIVPFITGIILQFYFLFSFRMLAVIAFTAFVLLLAFRLLPVSKKYSYNFINTFFIAVLLVSLGSIISFYNDVSNRKNCVINIYNDQPILVTLDEPLVTKPRSFKAVANINAVLINNQWQPVQGKTIIYFKKENADTTLSYGSQIIITTALQAISNSGNPGAFSYREYCKKQGIFYQCYLPADKYINTKNYNGNTFNKTLHDTRANIISILKKYITGKDEVGVAEALLIGYKNDLDNDLVQAYSNVGVVHIIAISGLHLGMIYAALLFLFRRFKLLPARKFLQPVIILLVLWSFTFLAGMVPSILRSAVMFSFIIIGDTLGRRTNIYNTLAASAFCMLAYDTTYLWDAGFQLSYAAVISIILFMKPINKLIYIKNKLLAALWSMMAITLAAQVFTTPIAMYHFHQFPNLFMLTNLLVVPLSTIILFGELLLIVIAFIPAIANVLGGMLTWLLHLMNSFIQRTGSLPFSVTAYIQINIIQLIALMLFASFIAAWLMQQNKKYLFGGLSCIALFFGIRCYDEISKKQHERLIVYNVNKHNAIDVMHNGHYQYYGDTLDASTFNMNIKPSRTFYRSYNNSLSSSTKNIIAFGNKTVLLIDKPVNKAYTGNKIKADIIIITGNLRLYMRDVVQVFDCPQYVFDATNAAWKTAYWKKDCDSLHLRSHSVQQQGAYVTER